MEACPTSDTSFVTGINCVLCPYDHFLYAILISPPEIINRFEIVVGEVFTQEVVQQVTSPLFCSATFVGSAGETSILLMLLLRDVNANKNEIYAV